MPAAAGPKGVKGLSREGLARICDDLGLFASFIGWELAPWQLSALSLETRQTVLISPRQCGKSRSLSVLAVWWAFRRPRQMVLVVSAGDEAASRLLAAVRRVAEHPLLAGSVVDETQHRVILSNGSEIRSVPASHSQIRGWSVDLLLIDEAAWVPADLLLAAALPTTAARPDARVVLASTPWSDSGPFWKFASDGENPAYPFTATYRWKLADAWWIVPEVIETARATLSPLQFRAEYEGEFVGAADSYFDQADLLAAVAAFPMRHDGAGMPAVAGLDWGRRVDAHAVVVAGLLDDCGVNGRPVVVVPWCETSRRPYSAQVAEIEALAAQWDLTVFSETVGVGQSPTETLFERLPRTRVVGVSTSQAVKEDCYGRVSTLLSERALVLPDHPDLLRQLAGVSARPTPLGRLRIQARTESLHDDLPDALALACGSLPRHLATARLRDVPEGVPWVETPAGVRVPIPVATTRPDISWFAANADLVVCKSCRNAYRVEHPACVTCGTPGAHQAAVPAPEQPRAVPQVPSAWGILKCSQGHPFQADKYDQCPRCHGRVPSLPAGGRPALPAGTGAGGQLGRRF
jgi:Terminase large subunit, T4likevirus-type, N-terminal